VESIARVTEGRGAANGQNSTEIVSAAGVSDVTDGRRPNISGTTVETNSPESQATLPHGSGPRHGLGTT